MIQLKETGRGAPSAIAAIIAIASTIMATEILASSASFAVPRYDGLWSVSIVTEKGDCDRGYRYPVRISAFQTARWPMPATRFSASPAKSSAAAP
jgi:hypothetical protein